MGNIPEFTSDDSVGNQESEVKETSEETQEEVKETPEESSPEIKPAEETSEEESLSEDTAQEVEPDVQIQKEQAYKEIIGLSKTKADLLQEIQHLRGERRTLKEAELRKVETQIQDELKDINPEDVPKVERIAKQRGFIKQEDVKKMFYDLEKERQLNAFLDKYPEFKPENDPEDRNWKALQEELGYYKMPSDPTKIINVLEKARKSVQPKGSERNTQEVKRNLATASKGGGGVQRSSVPGHLTSSDKEELRRGGFTESEIEEMNK